MYKVEKKKKGLPEVIKDRKVYKSVNPSKKAVQELEKVLDIVDTKK